MNIRGDRNMAKLLFFNLLCLTSLVLFVSGCGGNSTTTIQAPTTNLAPVASISSPAAGILYKAGETVNFSGSGMDPEDGLLSPSNLTWRVELHHDTYTDLLQLNNGSITIPTTGASSVNDFLRFRLRATDSAGLTNEVTRDIFPQTVQVTLDSQPGGLALTLDGQAITTPHIITNVAGMMHDIVASDQNYSGRKYQFTSWSDGLAGSHSIAPQVDSTFTAVYTDIGSETNQAPVANIANPPLGMLYKAGDTLVFSGSGTDPEDGALPPSNLTWWVDFHHDTHTHPVQLETQGNSGSVSIPTRGETSSNVFLRFHLRATDSAGLLNEITRDVFPKKAQLTFNTDPDGLALILDGQPITSPHTVTGVVGVERDLGTVTDQNFNSRKFQFSYWSDGLPESHTISTPAVDTTYTANFVDIGPVVNSAPVVSLSGTPATGTTGVPVTLGAVATDTDDYVASVEFFDGTTKLGEDITSPYSLVWTPTTTGVHSITAKATDNYGLSATSSAVDLNVSAPTGADIEPPVASVTSPVDLATGLTGMLTLSATATDNVGVTGLEIQLDGMQIGTTGTNGTHSVAVDSGTFASGQHVVRARARDAAGNFSPWASVTVQFGGGHSVPAGFTRNESWITGLSAATAFTQTPDGRLLVSEQAGSLRVVENGILLATPMLNVMLATNIGGEQGLLGVTVHPNFASNGYVYVYYTTSETNIHNRVSRFTVTGNVASNEEKLVDLPEVGGSANHNGGAIHFGIDGKLYVAVGEAGTPANAPDLSKVFGKLLRFNDDGTIPADNPFYNTQTGLARAIWAYGLRNPFTFAIQPVTGRMHINDVGQQTWEEINLGAPGANYGWPSSEGPENLTGGITGPMFTYKHSAAVPAGSGPGGFFMGYCIAGGAFYPDSGPFPVGYRNSYYFADYVGQFIGRFDWSNNASYAFATVSDLPVDLLTGSDGALYLLTRNGITRFSAP